MLAAVAVPRPFRVLVDAAVADGPTDEDVAWTGCVRLDDRGAVYDDLCLTCATR